MFASRTKRVSKTKAFKIADRCYALAWRKVLGADYTSIKQVQKEHWHKAESKEWLNAYVNCYKSRLRKARKAK